MLSNKIHSPRGREDLLVRPRLLETLADGAPLVLVTGPAGSGKSVLVRQWLDRVDRPAAWLTIDPRDNDTARFWTYFAAAVAASSPEFGWVPVGPLSAESLEALTDALARVAPLVLVLDDLHYLVEREVLEQLGQVVETLPAEVRLVLVSRTVPDLRLARHWSLGELVEVHGQDLLFTDDETARVLGRAEPDALSAAVFDSTRGWPVAVAFAARLPDPDPGGATQPHRTARSRQQIADYLTEEILRAQPQDVQDFLLDTSVLDEISVPAANAIRDSGDAATHLRHLERHDLFLTPLDGDGEDTWRHHALVRDHLRGMLERTQPQRWSDVHGHAARYYEPLDFERAVGHALAAPDPGFAADLIQRRVDEPGGLDSRVPPTQLLRWLEALPDDILAERGALRSFGLSLAAGSSRHDLVDRLLAARGSGAEDELENVFALAWRADVAGDMPTVRDACRRALGLCEPGTTWWRTMHSGLARAEYMLGHWDAAAVSFVEMRKPLLDPGLRRALADQEIERAFAVVIRARQGRSGEATAALDELREWLVEVGRMGYHSEGISDWAEAMVAFHAGDLETATRWDTLPHESQLGGRRLPPIVLSLDLARVRRAAGDTERAAELLADVRNRLTRMADPGRMLEWVAAEEAGIARIPTQRRAGRPPVADTRPQGPFEPLSEREREVLRLLRSEFSLPEIAQHLYVSYNTAKTHTRMIYRKLGVSSRSAAVARARVLGYL